MLQYKGDLLKLVGELGSVASSSATVHSFRLHNLVYTNYLRKGIEKLSCSTSQSDVQNNDDQHEIGEQVVEKPEKGSIKGRSGKKHKKEEKYIGGLYSAPRSTIIKRNVTACSSVSKGYFASGRF